MKTAIIHLSDLHLTEFENEEGEAITKSWFIDNYESFIDDIFENIEHKKSDLGITDFLLVISGDLSNTSNPDEYAKANEFITELMVKFSIEKNNVLIVPGNHDINWHKNREAYENYKENKANNHLKKTAHEFYEEKYVHFTEFYNGFYETCTFAFPCTKYIIRCFEWQKNILFICLNSTLEQSYVQEQTNIRRETFNLTKLRNELEEISKENSNYNKLIKIAILHHNPIKISTDPTSLAINNWNEISALLKKFDIRIFLFGHEHVSNITRVDDFCYISVGGLGNKDWGENSISILEFDENYSCITPHFCQLINNGAIGTPNYGIWTCIENDRFSQTISIKHNLNKTNTIKHTHEPHYTFNECTIIKNSPLLKTLDKQTINQILSKAVKKAIEKNISVCEKGQSVNCFWIILQGAVCARKDDRDIAVRKKGDVIGEFGFIDNRKNRSSKLITTSRTTLIEIPISTIEELDDSHKLTIWKNLASILHIKMEELQKKISKMQKQKNI